MRDWQTNTEADAATHARQQAWPEMRDEHDDGEPSTYEPPHRPEDCGDEECRLLLCVLARCVAEQKAAAAEMAKVREEVIRERNREWWAS